jgi:Transglutaminase-like superfamily
MRLSLFVSIVVISTHALPFSRIVQRMSQRSAFKNDGNVTLEYRPQIQRRPSLWSWTNPRSTRLSSTAENTSTIKEENESVHLKLNSEGMTAKVGDADNDEEAQTKKKRRKSTLLSYKDPKSKKTYTGLNISRRRFEAWLNYTLGQPAPTEMVSEEEMDDSPKIREKLREKWKSRELLCDRTELLTVYDSDKLVNGEAQKKKRGGFRDLLHLYADRFYGILADEKEETKKSLQDWLFLEYGKNETNQMLANTFQRRGREEQYRILNHFLEWFRSQYPYYYDRCDSCGSSYKEEPQKEDQEKDEGSFLGYVFPSEDELSGKAGRTELYQCHKCQSFTRFPRFNKAQAILDKHRGRCGEYSMLLYRMLSSMGHQARWIVDWSDHVWTEILLDDHHWIHLDPCEAAVDKPLLYQEWGKQQTYIIGFYSPDKHRYPIIEDLTSKYTSDDKDVIDQRREEPPEEFKACLAKATEELRKKIANLTAS